ncbi:MAG: diguanylate cyclase [Sphingomonas fennica]
MKPFASLGARIYGIAGVAAFATLLLGVLLFRSSYRTVEAFHWVNHTQAVIISLDTIENNLGGAESSLRGYLLSGDETFLSRFESDLRAADQLSGTLTRLTADNPLQKRRAEALLAAARAKAATMRAVVARGHRQGVVRAIDPVARAYGRRTMGMVRAIAATMRGTERTLMAERMARADASSRHLRTLLLVGCPFLVLLIAAVAWQLRAGITRPMADLLDAVMRFGQGDRDARAMAAVAGSGIEFRRLAGAYNGMAERLSAAIDQSRQAEDGLAAANAELREQGRALRARQRSIELLSGMAHRLHAIQGEGELSEVLDCYLPRVFPDLAGALYIHNHSRNLLVRRSSWGQPYVAPEQFQPGQCWGLRRGQPHAVDTPGADVVCAHATGDAPVERLCVPVIAGGEVLGLIYVEGLAEAEDRFRLDLLMENLALALVNDNLRTRLREQSIRDPMTTLFNRRYLEEAMQLETARAARGGTPLAVVMADVDHFKRFNDSNGHEAGDALLKAVAACIQSHFRHGDIVCRYGGEEFTVIAPGASAQLIRERVEELRRAVAAMTVEHGGRRLGPVTMSFGIEAWEAASGRAPEGLIAAADRALYRAKTLGRNRIEMSDHAPAALAAE